MEFCRWLSAVRSDTKPGRARVHWRRRSPWLAVSTFALLASAKTVLAEQSAELALQRIGSGNPVAGKHKAADERCQECHGEDGNSGDVRIPSHAGQYAGYLVKQLSDFKSGARSHEIMNVMAADLTPEDMADIAAYFASQQIMRGERIADNPLAKNLFVNGDAARDLPACASCHGENGKGKVVDNVIYPVIGGQRRVYLRSQLTNWKLGERKNSPEAVMNKVAKSLNDDELNALVEYLSGL
ncbi:c-type cytochrome [Methylomonas albis]|uniref:Cytochrome c4 n=1 Tax=Methylomonas albis TaxID=1854563 RepID=A0ABR9D0V8_9GAMM|nr:c-type cytochrome [Methylomonas albis]MBD9356575.1 cytochrome c4 [Methylomonas albis]